MKVNVLGFLLIGYFAFIAAGCDPRTAPNAPEPPTDPSPEMAVVSETPTIPAMPTQNDETQPLPIPAIASLQPLIEKAKTDLAQRLSIPASQINAAETKQVFWPDASLGCPQPGLTYTQVEVPGYLIILQSNGNEFEYHANIHDYIFYCENPTPPILETPTNGQP
jgi:hypothetical protein